MACNTHKSGQAWATKCLCVHKASQKIQKKCLVLHVCEHMDKHGQQKCLCIHKASQKNSKEVSASAHLWAHLCACRDFGTATSDMPFAGLLVQINSVGNKFARIFGPTPSQYDMTGILPSKVHSDSCRIILIVLFPNVHTCNRKKVFGMKIL